MKYLWLTFLICLVALIVQVNMEEPSENPFADGTLACLPMPPAFPRPELPLLPAPVIEKIPPPAAAVPVVATSIEIFNPQLSGGLMVETRHADNADWGLPRALPADSSKELAYAPEPKLVQPVPVNTPAPATPAPPSLADIVPKDSTAWSRAMEKFEPGGKLMAMASALSTPAPSIDSAAVADSSAELAPAIETAPDKSTLALYPVPDPDPVQMASVEPKRLVNPVRAATPNLYLPDGATDEEGAKLTLVSPELKVYELPDEQSASAPYHLKSGDQVRPLTRLRSATGYDWIKFENEGQSWWAQAEYFIRVDPRNRRQSAIGNLEIGHEKVDKDSALPVDYKPNDLMEIAGKYTFGAKDVRLRKDASEAFEEMAQAAEREGLQIRVFSGFRDFDYQKRLYLEAIKKDGPKQDGTAAPGYSEHQLGTTADICNEDRRTILKGTFGETPEGRWLHENSERYGFRKSYTSENSKEVGYKPEPWHFRYIGKPAPAAPAEAVAKK